jgi:hypothetical protein
MIPKPFVPFGIIEAQQEKPVVFKFDDYDNNVARFNPNTRQWEFKNGQMMNCGVGDGFLAGEE